MAALMAASKMWLGALALSLVLPANGVKDFSGQPTTIETDSLPTLSDGVTPDGARMPSIGNGHLATVIYSDSVFVNGVYNGQRDQSHRARIRPEVNVRVHFYNEQSQQIYRQYKLDMANGYWQETITSESCRVTHKVYAHQTYTRLLVVEIVAQRQGAARGNLMLYLNKTAGGDSEDIAFADKTSFNGGNWYMHGKTRTPEIPGGHHTQVYVYWSLVPPIIHIPSHKDSIRYTYMMSVDTNEQAARESFESGTWISDKNPEHFFTLHKDEWSRKWQGGGIQLTGEDNSLEKLSQSAFYYLLSSLPSSGDMRILNPYGGVSSTGLAHGGSRETGDSGHVSWDQEMWILPAVLPFWPSLAKSLLSYRVNTTPAAKTQALEKQLQGRLYSWHSAATGIDVTPSYLPRKHYHVNGDISLAARRYVAATRDKLWLQEEGGCELVKEIAAFWHSYAKYNPKTNRYDIKDVTPPDDSLGSVDDSVYTNAVASLSLHYAKYAACLCNIDVNVFAPFEWIITAQNLHWQHNNTMNFNPESKDFLSAGTNKALKQPGAVLLNYPVMWSQRDSTTIKNLQLYGSGMPARSPPTSWAMVSINLLEMGHETEAEDYFTRSYSPFVQEPFKIWTEFPEGFGKSNYLSGMASYLQALLYGFGGFRIHTEYISLNPRLPPKIHTMTFKDLDYLGSKFTVRVTATLIHVSVRSIGIYPLVLTHRDTNKEYHLVRDASVPIPRGYITIKSNAATGCQLPEDNILPVQPSTRQRPKSLLRGDPNGSAQPPSTAHHTPLIYSLLAALHCYWTAV